METREFIGAVDEPKEFISVKVAPYSLIDVLLALGNRGLDSVVIVQEDKESMIIRLDMATLKDIVYGKPRCVNPERK